jgi:hypothetical protein
MPAASDLGLVIDPCLPETPKRLALSRTGTDDRLTLRGIFRAHRGAFVLIYVLFTLENFLRIAQPLLLGRAINGLLYSSSMELAVFIAAYVAFTAMGVLRRVYNTRAFAAIYSGLATRVVVEQRGGNVATSRVAARTVLSRQYVDFFEHDVPTVLYTAYSLVGAVVMLAVEDTVLALLCLFILLPAGLLGRSFARISLELHARLHDQMEHEVSVIEGGRSPEVRGHFDLLARWRIKLSDREASNFAGMELFILLLIVVALVRCAAVGADLGSVFAVYRYVIMFVSSTDAIPVLIQQATRLRDIGRRVSVDRSVGDAVAGAAQ